MRNLPGSLPTPIQCRQKKFLTALPLPPLPKRIEPLSENSKDERPFS